MCGWWQESPLGPMADLMWGTPDGRRCLVAPSNDVAAFVSGIYRFDDVVVTPLTAAVVDRVLTLQAPELGLSLRVRAGRGWPVPLPPQAWIARWVAGPVARRVMGVQTYGVSPYGVREWYRARWFRPVVEASASLDGRDLGTLAPALDPPVNFGFSEPPKKPSMVWVNPLLHDSRGVLVGVLPEA